MQEEIRKGYLISKETKKIWSIQLDLLKKLLKVCEKYNLKIWADSGTLLGAIREGGYIPWDDDIDMVMLRPDYDKLIAIAEKEFKHPYYLQSGYSEKVSYPRGHAQLRNSDTSAILPADITQDFNQGIFIDIFVLDAVPTDQKELEKYIKTINHWKFMLCLRAKKIRYSFHPKHFIKCFLFQLISLGWSNKKIYSFYDNSLKKFNIEEKQYLSYVGLISKVEYVNIRMIDKHWFDETIYKPFENINIPIPGGYHYLMKMLYGENYMQPVKSPSAHGEVIFDTERSYKEVIKELRKERKQKR